MMGMLNDIKKRLNALLIVRSNDIELIYNNLLNKDMDSDILESAICNMGNAEYIYKALLLSRDSSKCMRSLIKLRNEEYLFKALESGVHIYFNDKVNASVVLQNIDKKYTSIVVELISKGEGYIDMLLDRGMVNCLSMVPINKSYILRVMELNEEKYSVALIIYGDYLIGAGDGLNLDNRYRDYCKSIKLSKGKK